jgi:pilus assembly protein CpaB
MKEIDEMKSRAVLVAAAVALALIGTLAVFAYVHNADKRAVAGTKASQVLIAHKEVPAGTSWSDAVKDGYLVAEKVPASAVPESALANVDAGVPDADVAGSTIASGQIVLREMFGTAASANTGAIAIPKGLLAISVTMSSNADVAGFVQPGSQIAVFGTFQVPAQTVANAPTTLGTTPYITDLVLPKVLVTATSQSAPTDVDGAKTASTGTVSSGGSVLVTVAVTQAQAQQLIVAQQAGLLYFALLSDSSVTSDDGGATNVAGTLHATALIAK